jgi:Anti-sigma-K factor rskA, C-terminal
MSDNSIAGDSEELADIEALLRELDPNDLDLMEPPADVWASISTAVAAESTAPVVSLDERRNRRRSFLSVAAAAVAVVGLGGVALVSMQDDGDDDVVATAVLEFDPVSFDPLGNGTSAEVSLVDDDAGPAIVVDEASLPDDIGTDADLEFWLIAADETGAVVDLVSLGEYEPGTDAPLVVPDGYDPSVYSVVDISIEPRDGDPTHSGRSILRGQLTTA